MPQNIQKYKPTKTAKVGLNSQLWNSSENSQAITVRGNPSDMYDFWRDLKNLPAFMKGIERVDVISPTNSHWVAKSKTGIEMEWDATIVGDEPGVGFSWQSLPDSKVETVGSVEFTKSEKNGGTVISLNLDFRVPGGKIAELIESMLGEDPRTFIQLTLRRFKAYFETGEIPTIEGQSSGREEASVIH